MDEEFSLDDLSAEELQQLIALGIIPEQMGMLNEQLQTAEALRYGDSPEGRDSGRIYTAANPMEHIGDAMQKYNAMKESKSVRQQQQEMLDQANKTRMLYADILRRKKKPAALEPPTSDGSGYL